MTSENRIKNTIGQLGELRELLLVIDQSGEVVPAILLKLARDKAQEIFGSIDALRSPEYWEELNQLVLSEWDEEIDLVEEPVFEEEAIAEESKPIFEEEVTPEEEGSIVEESVVEVAPEANLEEEEVIEGPFEENPEEEEIINEPFDIVPEEEENDFWDDEEEDFYNDEEEELFGNKENPEEDSVEADDTSVVLTLDEVLQRKRIQELRKALSLNDKFRFRRELFGNSDVRMNETLALIDAMESYDEAEDYLYGDLGWDTENPEVAEFMKIVQNRFL